MSKQFPVLFFACITLAGCFGTTAAVRPELQVKAESLIRRAIRAEQKNEYQLARQYLEDALQLVTSIEDQPAKAQTLVNLARLNRLNGERNLALVQIDQALAILKPDAANFSEAAHEKALTELANGGIAAAQKWAEKSVETENGDSKGRRRNLLGRILLAMNDLAAAEKMLNRALDENRKYGLNEEEANSLRMLGITARLGKRTDESELLLNRALLVDKQLAASNKIAADLEELSATAVAAGKPEQAANCLERASSVNLAAGRKTQAAANQATLARIYDLMGDTDKAAKARAKAAELSGNVVVHVSEGRQDTTNPSSRP